MYSIASDIKTLGPLSANSFMMTMRTKGDTTPDSLVPPDVPSESSSVSAEDVQFNFSEPMAVGTEKGKSYLSLQCWHVHISW